MAETLGSAYILLPNQKGNHHQSTITTATNIKIIALDCHGEIRRRKPTQGSITMADLPVEIITEILARLPAKILVEFRFVCKSWHSLISNPRFIRKHLTLSIMYSSKRTIIVNHRNRPWQIIYRSIPVPYQSSSHVFLEEPDHPYKNHQEQYYFDVLGSSDGLVCVKVHDSTDFDSNIHSIFLWNPCTREFKILPSNPKVHGNQVGKVVRYGFGYDYNGDDYKVAITLVDDGVYESMIYTLRKNSWRRIQNYSHRVEIVTRSAVYVSGALHWMVHYQGPFDSRVISLDLTSETYTEVPQPAVYGTRHDGFQPLEVGSLYVVGTSRGFLSILFHNRAVDQCDLWVLKEYMVPESWTRTITVPRNRIFLTAITRDPISCLPTHGSLLRLPGSVDYVESLISPEAYSKFGYLEATKVVTL